MNVSKMFLIVFAGCTAASSAFAQAGYVTNVLVRQRWPWSHKVDIDFTVGGSEPVDVVVHATWDGQSEPVELTRGNGLTGSAYGLCATSGHLVWDPEAAGISNTVTGFRARLSTATPDERRYLVVDLQTGAHEFLSEEPEGGFNSDDAYKSSKMVFRRIPSGTFTMGVTSTQKDILKDLGGLSEYYRKNCFRAAQEVAVSDDYYMAIYRVTEAQYERIYNNVQSGNLNVRAKNSGNSVNTYDHYRGLTNSAEVAVNWPATGYEVAADSVIGRFRKLTGDRFLIDLPTEAQWEHAERGTAETLWWNAGPDTVTGSEFTNYIASVCQTSPTSTPGALAPNGYGLYDMLSSGTELCLDVWTQDAETRLNDPVGPVAAEPSQHRVGKGGGENSQNTSRSGCVVPACRMAIQHFDSKDGSYGRVVFRLAIHLNPILLK